MNTALTALKIALKKMEADTLEINAASGCFMTLDALEAHDALPQEILTARRVIRESETAVPLHAQPVIDRWDGHKNPFQIPADDIRALIEFARTYTVLLQTVNDMGHFQCHIVDGVAHFKWPSSAEKVNAVPLHVQQAFDRLWKNCTTENCVDLNTLYNYAVEK